MASYTADDECHNFHRLVSLLIDVGTQVLRKLFIKYAVQKSSSLDQHLLNHKTKLETLQNKRHILSQSQMDLLYPSHGKADEATFDITLLSCLLKNVCGTLPVHERQNIEDLRECRNKIAGHMARAALPETDFKTQWANVSQFITSLAKCCGDVSFVKDVQHDIQDLWKKPEMRPSLHLNDVLLQWHKSDQEVKSELEVMKETSKQRHDEVTSKFTALKTTTEKVHKDTKFEIDELKATSARQHTEIEAELKRQSQMKKDIDNRLETVFQTTEELKATTTRQHTEIETELKRQSQMNTDINNRLDNAFQTTEELKQKVDDQNEKIDPALDKLRKISQQFLLSKTRQHFVETELMKNSLSMLRRKGTCIISGKPGEGKTLTAATIMKHYLNEEKCLVLSHPRDWNIVDIHKTEAIFVDDIFGIYQLDQGKLLEWIDVLPEVEACSGPNREKIKVIIATRSTILDECHATIGRFNLFKNIVEFSSDCLLHEEKVEMLSQSLQYNDKYLDAEKIRDCVSNFTSPIGFPFCCQLFSTNNGLFSYGEQFFRNPCKFFKDDLAALGEIKFASLVFLFHKKCEIFMEDLLENSEEHCNDLQHITASLGMQQTILPSVVRRQLHLMKGVYVIQEKGFMKFVHNTVLEAIGLLCGKSNPAYILRACSSDFLHQCLTVVNTIADQDEDHEKLFIEEYYYGVLIERLINEVIDRKHVSATAAHPAVRAEKFLTLFIKTIISQHLEKDFFTIQDRYGDRTFLSSYPRLFSNNTGAFIPYLSIILKYIGECKHSLTFARANCWKCEVRFDCMNACCQCGNMQACAVLINIGVVPDTKTLQYALWGGSVDIVRALIEYGAAPDTRTVNSAVIEGNVEIVRAVIENGPVPDAEVLTSAVMEGNIDIVTAVLEYGTLPETETLNYAVWGGNVRIVKAVMAHVNIPDAETLNYAVWGGSVDVIEALLKPGVVLNTQMLNSAVLRGKIDVVRVVLDHGAVPDTKSLNYAVQRGKAGIVRLVMDHGAVPDTQTVKYAVQKGRAEIVKALLDYGAVTNTEIMKCEVQRGNIDILRTVIEHGAVPDAETVEYAILRGNANIVKSLFEHWTEPDAYNLNWTVWEGSVATVPIEAVSMVKKSNIGIFKAAKDVGAVSYRNSLNYAVRRSSADTVRHMMERRAASNAETVNCAVQRGNTDIVRTVMEHGAVPDTETVNLAVRRGNVDICNVVMTQGAVPDAETVNCAVRNGNTEMVRTVLEHGAEPDTETLDYAVMGGNADIVKTVIKYGIGPDTQTVNYAVIGGNIDIVRTVIECGAVPTTSTVNYAVIGGRVDIIITLLEHRAVPNKSTVNYAVIGGNVDVVIAVMKHGAVPDTVTANCAVRKGNINIIIAVMEYGAIPDTNAVKYAIQERNVEIVNAVLKYGAVPDRKCVNWVVQTGITDIAKALMKSGFLPDEKAILSAVRKGKIDTFLAVLEHAPDRLRLRYTVCGTSLESLLEVIKGKALDTISLKCAIQRGNADIVRAVMEHGALPDKQTVDLAVLTGNVDVVRAVIEKGAVPSLCTINYAIQTDDASIVKEVLEHGASASNVNLRLAARLKNMEALKLLIEQVFPSYTDDFDLIRTALTHKRVLRSFPVKLMQVSKNLAAFCLYCAVLQGNSVIVERVIRRGVVPDTETLDFAFGSSKVDVAKAILKFIHIVDLNARTVDLAFLRGHVDIVTEMMKHNLLPDIGIVNRLVLSSNVDVVRLMKQFCFLGKTETVNNAIRSTNDDIISTVTGVSTIANTNTLQCAVWEGKIDIVREMIAKGAVPDGSLVRCAVLEGNKELIREVLKVSSIECNTNIIQHSGKHGCVRDIKIRLMNETVLEGNRVHVLREYLELGELPDIATLNRMILTGDHATVHSVIKRGLQVNANSLYNAILGRNTGMIRSVLEQYPQPGLGTQILRCAILENNLAIVKECFIKGAVPDARCVRCAEGNTSVLREVLQELSKIADDDTCMDIVHTAKSFNCVRNRKIQFVNEAVLSKVVNVEELIVKMGTLPDVPTINRMVLVGDIETVRVATLLGIQLLNSTANAAVNSGKVEMVRFVLATGVQADTQTLRNAIWGGSVEYCQNSVRLQRYSYY